MKNAVLFVTGANRKKGIGRALVEEAMKRGAKKVYATARDASQLNDLIEKYPGKVVAIELDVTNKKQVEQAAKDANDTQILINNAGLGGFSGCVHNFNEEIARKHLEVNYFGPLYLIRAFSENLTKHNEGAIVNIISVGGLFPFPPAATYCASKAAIYSMTQSARIELMPKNVSVFGVYPGPIDTDMADGIEVQKESPGNVATRVFDGMEQGVEEITTDPFSDTFSGYLKRDPQADQAIKKEFDS